MKNGVRYFNAIKRQNVPFAETRKELPSLTPPGVCQRISLVHTWYVLTDLISGIMRWRETPRFGTHAAPLRVDTNGASGAQGWMHPTSPPPRSIDIFRGNTKGGVGVFESKAEICVESNRHTAMHRSAILGSRLMSPQLLA